MTLILGSNDCKKPGFDAYSSAKMDSFKKDRAPVIERSIKLSCPAIESNHLSWLTTSLSP